MNINDQIRYWAQLVNESSEENQNESTFGGFGFTLPTELGRNINKIISPDILKNRQGSTKDLYEADFLCNTSTRQRIIDSIPGGYNNEELTSKLPDYYKPFITFIFKTDSNLNIDRVIEYMNEKCSDVLPFQLTKDNVEYVGDYNMFKKEGKRSIYISKIKE